MEESCSSRLTAAREPFNNLNTSTEESRMTHSIVRRRLLRGALGAAALSQVPFGLAAEKFPSGNMRGHHSDRAGRRRRPPRARVRRFLGTAAQARTSSTSSCRAPRARWATRLYIHKRAHDGVQPALRQHGAGDDHVRAAEARTTSFPQDYQYFCRIDVDDSVVFVLAEEQVPDAAAGPRREAKKRTRQRRGEPPAAPRFDRPARARQGDRRQVQPGALRRRQPDAASRC